MTPPGRSPRRPRVRKQCPSNGEHDLVFGDYRARSEQTAERKRPGVAHEDRGGRVIEPQKAEAGPQNGAAQHCKLAGVEHEIDLQILGEVRVADRPRDRPEAAGCDHDKPDRETIEPVSEVHGVAGANHDEGAEDHGEPAEIEQDVLEEGECKRRRHRGTAKHHERVTRGTGDEKLDHEARSSGNTGVNLPRHLEMIFVETDQAEAECHPKRDPDVRIAGVGPQHCRNDKARQDHEAANGGRARLRQGKGQPIDHRTKQKHENAGSKHRAAGAERDVIQQPEKRNGVGELAQPIEHGFSSARAPVQTRR
jgi:hypothetical protein